jgi:sterol 14-demethylase
MEFVLPTNLPLPRFRRRDRARSKLRAMLRSIIAERRADPRDHNDFLQSFLEVTYSDGTPLPEETIVDLILLMVFAAYETTSAQASWALIQLLQHPRYLALVLEEQKIMLSNEDVNLNTLHRLNRLTWAVKESERMWPVTTMLMRYVAKSYELGGYHIPQGWLTVICPAISHRFPEVFPNPDVYDPERFSPERAEDRQSSFNLVNFGGGLHKCLGLRFARNEIKVILSLLLQRYTLELVDPDPQPDYSTGLTRPRSPCLVRYRRST